MGERGERGEHESLIRSLRGWARLVRDPAGRSAERYRLKNTYDNVAVRSDLDRARDEEEEEPGRQRLRERLGRRLAARLAASGWGDEKADEPNPSVD